MAEVKEAQVAHKSAQAQCKHQEEELSKLMQELKEAQDKLSEEEDLKEAALKVHFTCFFAGESIVQTASRSPNKPDSQLLHILNLQPRF